MAPSDERVASPGRSAAGAPPAHATAAPLLLALASLLALAACAGPTSAPPPTQAETLCKGWGYAPGDPVCLNTFRRTGGQ